jgi:hypothetical protein
LPNKVPLTTENCIFKKFKSENIGVKYSTGAKNVSEADNSGDGWWTN